MTNVRNGVVIIVGLLALAPMMANGQDLYPQPPDSAPPGYVQQGYAPPQGDPNAMQQVPPGMQQLPPGTPVPPPQQAYTQQQMEQLVAPIALYPDQLIGQILMASTYPLEIVEAQRWRQNPQNAALTGPQLQAAMDQQPWDPSVKSLVAVPQVLSMLDNNLQWTEQLGDAFLASQPAIMDSVQSLRQRAQAEKNLASTPQQTVTEQQGEILIQPTNPQVVYVPYYNPQVVYGPWPWAAYPPYYFPPPPGYVYTTVGLFGFGVGLGIADWWWGWDRWDWHRHTIFVDDHRYAALNRGRAPQFAGGAWAHDPDHRHGVPYRSAAVRQQFQGAATQARAGYRGYFNAPQNRSVVNNNVRPASAASAQRVGAAGINNQPAARSFTPESRASTAQPLSGNMTHGQTPAAQTHFNAPAESQAHSMQPRAAQSQTRSAPMFESFSRGSVVRTQAARGSSSRASMPSAAPASHAAPAAQAHTDGGGAGGGHGEGRTH